MAKQNKKRKKWAGLLDPKPVRYDIDSATVKPIAFASEDKALEYLATILVEAYFRQKATQV